MIVYRWIKSFITPTGTCPFRQIISSSIINDVSRRSECENLHSRLEQRYVLRTRGCQVNLAVHIAQSWKLITPYYRSHLREIRDRSVLRLFESNEVAAAPQILSGNPGIPQPLPQQGGHWDQDPVIIYAQFFIVKSGFSSPLCSNL